MHKCGYKTYEKILQKLVNKNVKKYGAQHEIFQNIIDPYPKFLKNHLIAYPLRFLMITKKCLVNCKFVECAKSGRRAEEKMDDFFVMTFQNFLITPFRTLVRQQPIMEDTTLRVMRDLLVQSHF